MNAGKTVFAQVMEHLPRYEFDKFVKKYEGNHRVRRFPCYDQFLCLAYAQLTYRESLRMESFVIGPFFSPEVIFHFQVVFPYVNYRGFEGNLHLSIS